MEPDVEHRRAALRAHIQQRGRAEGEQGQCRARTGWAGWVKEVNIAVKLGAGQAGLKSLTGNSRCPSGPTHKGASLGYITSWHCLQPQSNPFLPQGLFTSHSLCLDYPPSSPHILPGLVLISAEMPCLQKSLPRPATRFLPHTAGLSQALKVQRNYRCISQQLLPGLLSQ